MTIAIPARARAEGRRWPDRIRALIDAWIARDAYRRQLHQLRQLDDRLLRDMGLTPDDVRDPGR